jgi:hypothetical protein
MSDQLTLIHLYYVYIVALAVPVSIWLNQSCTEAARRGGAGCNNGCDVDCAFIAADMCDCSPLVVLDTPGLCGSDQASSLLSFVATVPAMSHLMDDADREGLKNIYIYRHAEI